MVVFSRLAPLVKSNLNNHQEKTKAKSAVAAQLPFEILRKIFLLAVTLSDHEGSSSSIFLYQYAFGPLQSREPLSFTYVCSWWRSAAISIPELWGSLSATLDPTGSMTSGVIKIWLQNAKTSFDNRTQGAAIEQLRLRKVHALNLHLAPSSIRNVDLRVLRYNLRTLHCFWEHISRCRSINLHMDREMLLQFRDSLVFQAPLLEDVEIQVHTSNFRGQRSVLSWLRRLPALKRLCLSFPFGSSKPVGVHQLPYDTLEELFLAVNLDFEGAVNALTGCLSAKKVQFKGGLVSGCRPPIVHNHAILHHLTSLVLDGFGDPAALLDYVTLPSLTVLVLRSTTLNSIFSSPLRCLENFLERSSCALDKLIVHDQKFNSASALSLLRIEAIRPTPIVEVYFASLFQRENQHMALLRSLPFLEMFFQSDFKNLRVLRREVDQMDAYFVGWGLDVGPGEDLVYEHGIWPGDRPRLPNVVPMHMRRREREVKTLPLAWPRVIVAPGSCFTF